MRKTISCIVLAIVLEVAIPARVLAEDPQAGSSGVLKNTQSSESKLDYRVYTLQRYLNQFDSPLSDYSSEFVKQADANQIDWRMVPAISGVESTFGKAIPYNSYNAYGWVNGDYSFESWPDSIQIVSKTLKENYIDQGAISITQISRIYAPPSTTWGGKVKYFVNQINPLPLSYEI